ncbi:MAG TPA: hypothetical protein VEB19_03120, partial [Gemmatimonadaceae bacterium]|nr:hypothetical protein [Gemmatimonadaceae bacterium]
LALMVGINAAGAQDSVPVRRISTAAAVSKEKIGNITGVRELPDGRVLVNDGANRRLLLLDTMLVIERVVLDSASERADTYGNRPGALIAHRGDSSLFIDPNSLAMLVIGPDGNIARVRSVPRAQDVGRYTSGASANLFTDARGRLIYRMTARAAPPAVRPPRGVPYIPPEPDSAFVVALDMDSRKLDTLGVIRIPKEEYTVRVSPNGGWSFNEAINPIPTQDAWAVLSDGTVAFVRWIDYRVDYLNPDGSWSSSAKLPYEWQPISAADKERIVDSVQTSQQKSLRNSYTTSVIRYVNTYGKKYPPGFTAPEGYRPPNGFGRDWNFPPGVNFPATYIYGCARDEEAKELPPAPDDTTSSDAPARDVLGLEGLRMAEMMNQRAAGGGRPSCIPQAIPNLARIPNPPTMREVSVINEKYLPDFHPPFTSNAVRADLDGNLWIRTVPVRRVQGGPIYDVVSREGKLVDRLQVPPGYQLAGFGRDRVVFLTMRDREGIHLARVRLR